MIYRWLAIFRYVLGFLLSFGSKTRGSRTGIIFNNEMDDFSTPGTYNSFGVPASPTNFIEPGKMPMSSMCPTLVADETGSVIFMGGGSGGTRITTGTSFVSSHLWQGLLGLFTRFCPSCGDAGCKSELRTVSPFQYA